MRALAAHHEEALAGLGGAARQGDQLGDAQARGVEELEQAGHAGRPQALAGSGLGRAAALAGDPSSRSTSSTDRTFGSARPRFGRRDGGRRIGGA